MAHPYSSLVPLGLLRSSPVRSRWSLSFLIHFESWLSSFNFNVDGFSNKASDLASSVLQKRLIFKKSAGYLGIRVWVSCRLNAAPTCVCRGGGVLWGFEGMVFLRRKSFLLETSFLGKFILSVKMVLTRFMYFLTTYDVFSLPRRAERVVQNAFNRIRFKWK